MPKTKTIDLELLPNEKEGSHQTYVLPRIIALLMDDLIKIPGTRRRFGLNPVLDLIPVVGDSSAALISAMTLFVAMRQRVPKVVIARMGLNIMLNGFIGIIPGVGEAFAFWFRPSHRNYELLKAHSPTGSALLKPSTRKDTVFVVSIVGVILLLFVSCAVLGAYVSFLLARALFAWH